MFLTWLLVMKPDQSVGDALSTLRRRHLLPSLVRACARSEITTFSKTLALKISRLCIFARTLSAVFVLVPVVTHYLKQLHLRSKQECFRHNILIIGGRTVKASSYAYPAPGTIDRFTYTTATSRRMSNQKTTNEPSTGTDLTRSMQQDPTHLRDGLVGLLEWVAEKGATGRPTFLSPSPSPPAEAANGQTDWDNLGMDGFQLQPSYEEVAMSTMANRLLAYLQEDGAIEAGSDDEPCEWEDDPPDSDSGPDDNSVNSLGRQRNVTANMDKDEWFPWPDKKTCILDILRHIPRCSFSDRQNSAIHWAMGAAGITDLPSERSMKEVDRALQRLCGIQTLKYYGALGNIYYMNDFAAIIAQEMANPRVCLHLHFMPEDAGPRLEEVWQARRWLHELDSDLTTQNHRQGSYDYFLFEPAMLQNGAICMPTRWFKQGSRRVANGPILPWKRTDPDVGNKWRKKAGGRRVVAFPIWLYCDDTSGNLSKRWNKHNSFLFTAAGLPRRHVHQEHNVHFLSTSNLAPPLEMLDAFVDQLSACQRDGVWAWDCILQELVLVIPSVLAMLGDNPMQSEMACHVGLMGKLFCRVCRVVGDGKADAGTVLGRDGCPIPDSTGEDIRDDISMASGSDAASAAGSGSDQDDLEQRTSTRKAPETEDEMRRHISHFMESGQPRTRTQTVVELRSQFATAKRVGGMSSVKKMRTMSGVKDTFQHVFVDKLFSIAKRKGVPKPRKQEEMDHFVVEELPGWDIEYMSPVWWICDTPVEILHVILLGFVKYLWRDAIARISPNDRPTLIARLSSIDVAGLGVSPIAGATLVNYSGSLTGRDFRVIAQVAPFVLQGLPGLPDELLDVWAALARLVALVWEPQIEDATKYYDDLKCTIDHFLEMTCRCTPRWFNKPKFHIILHLPEHVLRFGPAMLFATEGFKSFNAVIWAHSVHSNHQAPSRDIALAIARCNRTRHLLSSGQFPDPLLVASMRYTTSDESEPSRTCPSTKFPTSPWLSSSQQLLSFNNRDWVAANPGGLSLIRLGGFSVKLLGIPLEDDGAQASPGMNFLGLDRNVN
ncbi:hypothetical protein OF83DRAFT_1087477 [Amylostereum chailletii]|nr:hypothetical protein OF83DRAFT_1087477 [Amylostereum chailletii]